MGTLQACLLHICKDMYVLQRCGTCPSLQQLHRTKPAKNNPLLGLPDLEVGGRTRRGEDPRQFFAPLTLVGKYNLGILGPAPAFDISPLEGRIRAKQEHRREQGIPRD